MLLPTHLAVTTAVAKGLGLTGIDLAYALVFGVLIDLDHLFVSRVRLKSKKFWLSDPTHCDHSWLHEPFGLLAIATFSLVINSWVPLLFYGIHFIIDQFVLRAKNKPLAPFSKKEYTYGLIPAGSKIEWFISPFLLIASIVYIIFK